MATYGKKKKGLLSSFSVFQDDKPGKAGDDPKAQRTGEMPLVQRLTRFKATHPMILSSCGGPSKHYLMCHLRSSLQARQESQDRLSEIS